MRSPMIEFVDELVRDIIADVRATENRGVISSSDDVLLDISDLLRQHVEGKKC